MNLPVILDIAIGLVFIYLIASLLASEIQELVSTLLQWRAKHLKESIQNLLAGGQGDTKTDQLNGFLEAIYSDPLIKNMNQSARGLIGTIGQWFYHKVFYRQGSIFGAEGTAPSYISPDTFATALLERIGLESLITKLTEIRLEKFIGRLIGLYQIHEVRGGREISIPDEEFFKDKDYRERGSIRVLADKARSLSHPGELSATARSLLILDNNNADFVALVEEYDDVLRDFKAGEADLETCVERLKEGLDIYINQVTALMPANGAAIAPAAPNQIADTAITSPTDSIAIAPSETFNQSSDPETAPASMTTLDLEKQQLGYFKRRLIALKLGTFGEVTERAIESGKLQPSLLEMAEVFDRASMTYQEIEGAYKTIAAAYATGMIAQQIRQVVYAINAHLMDLKKKNQLSAKSPLSTLPARPLSVADLAEEHYQPAFNAIMPYLSLEERQIFKNWQLYQTAFVNITRAIATHLQNIGRLNLQETSSSVSLAEVDLKTLQEQIDPVVKSLTNEEHEGLDQAVLAQLSADDQLTYQGWRIFQRVILAVIQELAQTMLSEGRLFDYRNRKEFDANLAELDEVDLYQSVKYSLNLLSNEERRLRVNTATRKLVTEDAKVYSNYESYEQIQDLLGAVPASVKQSLAILARRAQTKVSRTKHQVEQFNFEVARWFDHSMGRASGVYKRNAKGVAIIIGFVIAFLSNIDTFHVVARLSSDDDLRQVITNRASTIVQNTEKRELADREDLRDLKRKTDSALQDIGLPLQWTPENLSQQFNCRSAKELKPTLIDPTLPPWRGLYKTCLNEDNAPERFDALRVFSIATRPQNMVDSVRMLIGWFVSGVAIAMGAPFWFDLLSKIMNVRNAGTKPAPVTDRDAPKSSS